MVLMNSIHLLKGYIPTVNTARYFQPKWKR